MKCKKYGLIHIQLAFALKRYGKKERPNIMLKPNNSELNRKNPSPYTLLPEIVIIVSFLQNNPDEFCCYS